MLRFVSFEKFNQIFVEKKFKILTRLDRFYAQCYKKILELEPENVQGLHNLCVVYVERGNLIEAENCLKRVHILAPDEDYIIRHLQIVQTRIGKSKVQTNSSNVSKSL